MKSKKNKLDNNLAAIEKFWWKPTMVISFITIAMIFGSWVWFQNTDYGVALNMINQWMSVILGLVALTTSIISTLLGFYSMHCSEKSSIEITRQLASIKQQQDSMEKSLNFRNDTTTNTNKVKDSNENLDIGLDYKCEQEVSNG